MLSMIIFISVVAIVLVLVINDLVDRINKIGTILRDAMKVYDSNFDSHNKSLIELSDRISALEEKLHI